MDAVVVGPQRGAARSPHLHLAHQLWRALLAPGDTVIDATCGKGQDTLRLAQLVTGPAGACGQVIGVDLQPQALEQAQNRLALHLSTPSYSRVRWHQGCHSQLGHLPWVRALTPAPRLVVYNLGYLPGGDKSITTRVESTLSSLEGVAPWWPGGGALSITCYPGHPEGAEEERAILAWAARLPSATWLVRHHRWINRPEAPSLFWLVRLSE